MSILYEGFRKRRVAKKYMNWKPGLFLYLSRWSQVRIGDVIHTCNGFNDRVTSIEPEYRRVSRGRLVVRDFDVTCETGNHSAMHCCGLDLLSRDEIIRYFVRWNEETNRKSAMGWGMLDVIATAQACAEGRGETLFDEQGCPTPLLIQLRAEAWIVSSTKSRMEGNQ